MKQTSMTGGVRYISSMLGELSEDEYQAIDRGFSEAIKVFGRLRQRPAMILIEKRFGGRTLKKKKIYNYLREYGFSKGISQKVMSKLIANEISVLPDLQYKGYDIKSVEYSTDYKGRLEILGLKEVIPQYPRQEEIKVRPIQVITPPPPECSVFEYLDDMQGKREVYKTINQKDIFPVSIEDADYDGALEKVHSRINRIVENFFGGNLTIEDSKMSPGITPDCPNSRTYEFEIYDKTIHDIQYALKYAKGNIQLVIGGLPVEKIINVLREAKVWEE